LIAHATYLINLATTDPENLTKSRRALGDELDRCARLEIPYLVVHPGAHLGAGEEIGLERIADSVRDVFAARPDCATRLLLEITAGQGTVLGNRLHHLATIRDLSACPERLGLCVDTCHAFAAGYPIHLAAGYDEFFQELWELFDSDEPRCLHLNDSRHELGSRRDRHANLGEGHIGLDLFQRLVGDERLARTPMILETPIGSDEQGHRRDLDKLRKM
jgi:deoxyribonuclease-4